MEDQFIKKILQLQNRLKAPKCQYNSFAKYKYRSCEDIIEAVKPILYELGLVLLMQDEIICIGDRYYVKATATLLDENDSISASALAQEAGDKKGIDLAQLTGCTSSYARKYALNGLFCIDDTKDADTDERHTENANRAAAQSTKTAQPSTVPATASARKRITMEQLDDAIVCDQLMKWMYGFLTTANYAADFDAGARLLKSYDADAAVVERFSELFESYRQARKNAK